MYRGSHAAVVFLQPLVAEHARHRRAVDIAHPREGRGSRMGLIGLLVVVILIIILLRLIA
jgi:hypothetical protein